MSGKQEILTLDPALELRFKGPFNDVVTTQMKVTNSTDRSALFKIKTTAPKSYCVRPNSGAISPGQTAMVTVMLQPFDFNSDDKPKHKFMVQSMFAPDEPYDAEKIWKEAKTDDIIDVRLKCAFEVPSGNSAAGSTVTGNTSTTGESTGNALQASLTVGNNTGQHGGTLANSASNNNFMMAQSSIAPTASALAGAATTAQSTGGLSVVDHANDGSATRQQQQQHAAAAAASSTPAETRRLQDENRRLNTENNSLRIELASLKEDRTRLRSSVLQDTLKQPAAPPPLPRHTAPMQQADTTQLLLQSPIIWTLLVAAFLVGAVVSKIWM